MSVDALKLDNVKKNFAGTEIIRGLNLSVAKDERHAVIGPNGAGKSTAYNLITGRYQVSSGKVFLNGEDITNLQPYEVKRKGLSLDPFFSPHRVEDWLCLHHLEKLYLTKLDIFPL